MEFQAKWIRPKTDPGDICPVFYSGSVVKTKI